MHMHSYPVGSMQFARGLISWDNDPPSLSLTCKRLRPLAPKLTTSSFDLKTFIRPDNETRLHTKLASPAYSKQVEITQGGGTRWNPTQEQIGILEMMYRGGMRTPNAQQIEQITLQLGKYGKIEGKNVFYWFQNHKARERQKQKRNLAHSPTTSLTTITLQTRGDYKMEMEMNDEESGTLMKRKRTFEWLEEERRRSSCSCRDHEGDRTLKLFPLHPELADHK